MKVIIKVLIWFSILFALYITADEKGTNLTTTNVFILFISLALLWLFYNLQDKEFKNKVIKLLTKI